MKDEIQASNENEAVYELVFSAIHIISKIYKNECKRIMELTFIDGILN